MTTPKTWLVLDAYFLGYRALHSKGWMEFGSIKTGVIYGILQDILTLQDMFGTSRVVFAFDYGKGKRKDIFPGYKAKRRADMTPEEEVIHRDFKVQMAMLRRDYLRRIGYRNILWESGYEADDIIATCCRGIPPEDEAIIVSADQDLYQLLAPNVFIHNPNQRRTITLQSFKKEWGIEPKLWAKVKAIAGCKGDDVPGIYGVGEKKAIQYLLGTMKSKSPLYAAIKAGWQDVVLRNRPLVQLPLQGCPTFELAEDQLSPEGWAAVAEELGLGSLKHRMLQSARGSRRPLTRPGD